MHGRGGRIRLWLGDGRHCRIDSVLVRLFCRGHINNERLVFLNSWGLIVREVGAHEGEKLVPGLEKLNRRGN